MEEKVLIYETPEKPEIEVRNIPLDCSNFDNPDKAEALIKSLNLSVGDNIKQDSDEEFTINPKMELKGYAPEKYKREIEEVKKILTEKENKAISLYFKRKKEDNKIRNKIYYSITKRVEKLYNWSDEKKEHTPKTNSKRCVEVCKSLDWIHNENYLSGFSNIIYNLLSKEKQDFIYCYRCSWFNNPIPNIQEWKEENEGEYLVLTESEADSRAEKYLIDDDYLWKQAVESGNTTDSLEEWAKYVLNCDGRGSVLIACEESQEEINGVTYDT